MTLASLGLVTIPTPLAAQAAPVIDTIIVERRDVFTAEQAAGSGFFRTMNALHVQTHSFVVRRELLFAVGDPYDQTLIEETARNLRRLEIFSDIAIDSVTANGRFTVIVRTQDGWSTSPQISFQVASDGNLTYNLGVTEGNLVGTANLVHAAYRKDVDRTALDLATKLDRVLGPNINFAGQYENFSDGRTFNYLAGDPFRLMEDRAEFVIEGESTNRRMLQYRATATSLDTNAVQRRASLVMATGGWALSTSPSHYWRIGGGVFLRNERFVDTTLTASTEDSVTGAVSAFIEWRSTRFLTMERFNGLGSEDIDISTFVHLGVAHTPDTYGYDQNGWGPIVKLAGTVLLPNGFLTGAVEGHGIFDSNGLDSGLVEVRLTAGFKPGDRHATVVHAQAGAMEGQTPGSEFDLGFVRAPRSWEPHSFVGTRSVWATAEHKFFVADALLGLFGFALAGFIDYGGAWYPDQDARFGGNVGIGIRAGSALGTVARTGRIDVGYRFGDGVGQGNRWVFSVGAGWVFGGGRDPSCIPASHQVRYRCRGRF